MLAEAGELSRELNAPIFHTGDLIDYVSLANLEAVTAFTDTNGYGGWVDGVDFDTRAESPYIKCQKILWQIEIDTENE